LIDLDRLKAEADSFKYYAQERCKQSPDAKPIFDLLTKDLGYPLLRTLSSCIEVTPCTTASVERSFSTINRIHTRLRSKLSSESLSHLMMVAIEGPDKLSNEAINDIMRTWSSTKCRRIIIFLTFDMRVCLLIFIIKYLLFFINTCCFFLDLRP
jgi:hypothetical protein